MTISDPIITLVVGFILGVIFSAAVVITLAICENLNQ